MDPRVASASQLTTRGNGFGFIVTKSDYLFWLNIWLRKDQSSKLRLLKPLYAQIYAVADKSNDKSAFICVLSAII